VARVEAQEEAPEIVGLVTVMAEGCSTHSESWKKRIPDCSRYDAETAGATDAHSTKPIARPGPLN